MSEQTSGSFNVFSNDGSFMERFKLLQEQAKKEEKSTTPPVSSGVAGQKTVPFRLGAKRISKRPTPVATAAAAFDDNSDREEEEEGGRGQPRPPPPKG